MDLQGCLFVLLFTFAIPKLQSYLKLPCVYPINANFILLGCDKIVAFCSHEETFKIAKMKD